jgi:GT2 family glycosyltransferase
MRFTVLAAPGSDPGEAASRASRVVPFSGSAALAAAARAAEDPYLLILGPGARPLAGAFGGFIAAVTPQTGVLGGAMHAGATRLFGWMLAPSPCSPIPFELSTVSAPLGEAGADALVRGPIDAVAPFMLLAARELLLDPLPDDPVAASIEVCVRARAAGRSVICRPSFACTALPLDADDRGRTSALRALAERHPELAGVHRLPSGARRVAVERELRLDGGRRVRARVARPPLTILTHGADAAGAARRARERFPEARVTAVESGAAEALRAEMRRRGDRYVLIADGAGLPDATALEALVDQVESAPFVAMAAPSAQALRGDCVLLAVGRFPQQVEADGATLEAALDALRTAAHALRRAVRAPGDVRPVFANAVAPRATIVFLASSLPEISRLSLDAALAALQPGDDFAAVCGATAETARRVLAAYPQVQVETDAVDPFLTDGANRALANAAGDVVVLLADDVMLPTGTLERLRDAFVRIPSLGAAFPTVPGAAGGEGAQDIEYADVGAMQGVAQQRAQARAREMEPITSGATPAVALSRAALGAVGGIDPAYGPTRSGIAELVSRLRCAGYGVVRCDDALAHRFDAALSRNPAAAADAVQPPPVPVDPARGFDPESRVPFVRALPAPIAAAEHVVALAVAGPAELERAIAFLTAAANAYDARSPVRISLLLDGTVGAADAVARIRPILAAGGSIDESVSVRIERVADLAAWRAALPPELRLRVAAGHERPALAGLSGLSADALGELLDPALR